MNIFFQHLGRRSISNILQHLGGGSRHMSINISAGAKSPDSPSKTNRTGTSQREVHMPGVPWCVVRRGARAEWLWGRVSHGARCTGPTCQHILSTFRCALRSQHANILSIFRCKMVNMQHPHFGRLKSIFSHFLNAAPNIASAQG